MVRAEERIPAPLRSETAPFRDELLGDTRLANVARALGHRQRVSFGAPPRTSSLAGPLDRAEREIHAVYRTLAADAREDIPVAPAAEWLLDNLYLADEQTRVARDDLEGRIEQELPRLTEGAYAGLPRLFEAVIALLSHSDAKLDRERLERFLMAYQDTAPLTIGEVWAVPVALRIALLENLRRLSAGILAAHQAVVDADRLADRLLAATPEDAGSLLAEVERGYREAPDAFIVRLSQRLAAQEMVLAPLADWLERALEDRDDTLEHLAMRTHQAQAADQVSIANTITSLRFLGAHDWRDSFEAISLVEHALREDPADVYGRMDFDGRDRYRHAVEGMARRCALSEVEVARAAVAHAADALAADPADTARGHVGYHLIAGGRVAFERDVGYAPHLRERLYRGPLAAREAVYWGSLAVIVASLVAALGLSVAERLGGTAALVAVLALAVIPLSDAALVIANRIAAWLWPPRILPRLDHRRPVQEAHRTIVVYTALLTSPAAARHVIDNMEIGHLANIDPNVRFGILADLKGASSERAADDDAILDAATRGVHELNARYATGGAGPFHLFVRGRAYNERDRTWMGWERKRGALTEFCRLLRGDTDTSFIVNEGAADALRGVTFVITLDTDTVLPRNGARSLISTIAHPLNRAVLDPGTRTVRRGYGLVQPRVAMTLEGSDESLFAWLHSGATGIDPYAGAVSDTYMDVFGEGSFTGKGIFEVDIFNAALGERFPENRLLSHDLLEGSYLRTALASDIEVLDDQPSSYISHCARLHRWVRGDWQTLPWLAPYVPTPSGGERSPLTAVHRFKILDNLRRSLSAPATVAFAITGFALLRNAGWAWLAVILTLAFFPVLFRLADAVITKPRGTDAREDMTVFATELRRDVLRALLAVATLPHQAHLMTDAVSRALWRMLVSRRGLLEWETAAEAERRLGTTAQAAFWRRMWSSVAIALVAASIIAGAGGVTAVLPAVPLLILWAAGPLAAWRASVPLAREESPLGAEEYVAMRRTARKTWRFFETFVTAEDHHLAPDNFQEDPKGEVAHRTSPTNIGLQLLAYLSAYDLGYQTIAAMVDRVSRTLQTMVGMERFRGHFYNWYDTRTLEPLRPTYVSTVDSGNLAGHLLTLRVGMIEVSERPLIAAEALDGIADTARIALEDLQQIRPSLTTPDAAADLRTTLEEVLRRIALDSPPTDAGAWLGTLEGIAALTAHLSGRSAALLADDHAALDATHAAVAEVVSIVAAHHELLETYAPWARDVLDGEGSHAVVGDPALAPILSHMPSLAGLAEGLGDALDRLDAIAEEGGVAAGWAGRVAAGIREGRPRAQRLLAELRLHARIAGDIFEQTDFAMLYDPSRMLFSIGYNTAEGRLDGSCYDMLASECRLASFLAIATGDVGQEHWFRLGRPMTRTEGGTVLISWSASMFEYLMPLLVMRTWEGTLLERTYVGVVRRQIQYGEQRGVPWGVSESAFNAKDVELTYQYQAFGVPGLGLKRGLSADLVIAPYATVLALMVAPAAALANLRALTRQGAEGRYGYYEAIDYTPGRVPPGKERAIVRAYMAHHQGMSLVALGNVLTGMRMRERFHADPLVASAELLLQERVPRRVALAQPRVEEVEFVRAVREMPAPVTRAYPLADTPTPATHFLSNGSYSVMVTTGGGGYSRWRDRTVTRYREDLTRDCWGTFIYVRDRDTGRVWSAAHQPTLATPDDYHVTFSADRAEYVRRDGGVETHTEVFVSPEDDIEIRRVTITNHGLSDVQLEITSYLEVTLAVRGADQAHKAYSNLFVETEVNEEHHALLFTRRPRSAEEPRLWGVHLLACELDEADCGWTYETDRASFIGRLRSPVDPRAMADGGRLGETVGAVLDPICAIRRGVSIPRGETVRLAYITGAADSRDAVITLAERYRDLGNAQRAADLAWSTSQIELKDLGITPEESVTFLRLASRLLLTDPHSRLKVLTEVENRLPMSALWQIGISGDYPILLLLIERLEEAPLVRQALLAHQYWRSKGFECDLVILNTKPSGYSSELDGRLRALMRTGHALQLNDRPGGVFLRRADHMQPEVRNLLESVARVVITGDTGPIALQLARRAKHPEPPDPFVPSREPEPWPATAFRRPTLAFDNTLGGFDLERDEYVIVLRDGQTTPTPWVNVMATQRFGALVSEAGIGCTWAENSHENRITTWNNDPVCDGSGECLYIRDEETGEFWSPTPLPVRGDGVYVVRHGRGYTRFEHEGHGIAHTVDWFVARSAPVRVVRLLLRNTGNRERSLSVTQFIEWVLGDSRSAAQQRVVTWFDESAEALMAHSWFNADFPGRPAFLASDGPLHSYTASRTEFIGRNGAPAAPAAMRRVGLGGQTGRFHDNCGALMRRLTLMPGEEAEVTFLLGQTATLEAAHETLARFRTPGAIESEFDAIRAAWRRTLSTIEARTPDAALDAMVNGAALYQSLACRFWGRTATYQSSGAFGFRDQLQDCLALIDVDPALVRDHIIEAARRQFVEGDVLHWWQPVSGRGVRTRFSDDRHWLPFVVAEYVLSTGDHSVLGVETPYIEGPAIPEGREDLYLQPQESLRLGTIYEHCCAALDLVPLGEHGLPLMGGGDWNDGMNRVGIHGRGESVWLAWFLDVTMRSFARAAELNGDAGRAASLRDRAASLIGAVEEHAWDGAWYRRAYFDDGTPLGTAEAAECRIDAIAQAWSVLSGRGDPERAAMAMESVEEHLISREDGLVRLLTPPFDAMPNDPGYIKGYLPGVRENGGQYTHAALWVALAFARLGDGDEAVSLLGLINPVGHARDADAVARYKVEPYVLAADVYAIEPHVGRGGWTWYTGSAAWFARVAIREVLGFRTEARDGRRVLIVDPCIPRRWPGFELAYRFGTTVYRVRVDNPRGVTRGVAHAELDGRRLDDVAIPLVDDGGEHSVVITLIGG